MPANKRSKKIIALDWDGTTLRIVHALISKRGTKIDRLLAAPIPREVDTDDPQQLGLHIRRVLTQEDITTRRALADIPREKVILKTLRLPRIKVEELAGVVHIQIAKELPFPTSEAVIDFVVEGEAEEGASHQDVLVAAIRRDDLDSFQRVFDAAGLKLDAIGLRPHAHSTAVNELLKFSMPDRVLFMDVRPTYTEIDVLRNGALVFARAASVAISPGAALAELDSPDDRPSLSLVAPTMDSDASDEDRIRSESVLKVPQSSTVNKLLMEVSTSLEAYRADDSSAEIDHIIVAGDLGVEEALAEALNKRFNVTAEQYNPAATFGWEPEEGAAAAAFAATLGLVLSYADLDASTFDFLHPRKMVSVTQERLKKAPLVAAVIGLIIVAPVIWLENVSAEPRADLARIEKQIAELEEGKSDRKKFMDFVDTVHSFDAEQYVWVDVLHEIFDVLPDNEEIVLTQIDLQQKDGRVTLKTKTIGRDTPTEIVRKLGEYRREDRTEPRFKASVGPQSEKKGERYSWWQDIRISVLDDTPRGKKSRK